MHQTKISTKTNKDGFSPAVFRSRLEHKIPVTEFLAVSYVFSQCSRVSLLKRTSLHKPKANFWGKNQLYYEARLFLTEKSSGSFTASFSFLRDCKGRGYRRDRRAGQTERKTVRL